MEPFRGCPNRPGDSPRDTFPALNNLTNAKLCEPAQLVLSGGQSPGLVPGTKTEYPLNAYLNIYPSHVKAGCPDQYSTLCFNGKRPKAMGPV